MLRKVIPTLTLALLMAACTSNTPTQVTDVPATVVEPDSISLDTILPANEAEQPAPDTLTLALVGDIMLGTTYPTTKLPPHDGRDIFVDASSILKGVDLACGNLEGVLADSGTPRKNPDSALSFSFLMPTRLAPRLSEAGFDFLGLANNHANDFSAEGRNSTMHTLDKEGILYAGNSKCPQATTQVRGMRVGLCAFGHNQGTLFLTDTARVHSIIADLKRNNDIVVVCFHGGREGVTAKHLPDSAEVVWGENRGHLRRFTHQCIDWGADVVYGHGPHVVRAMEVYKDRFIAYSLGNFATPTGIGTAGLNGYAPLVELRVLPSGKMAGGRIHPFVQHPLQGPRRDTKGVVINEIRNLTREDIHNNQLTIDTDGKLSLKQ